MKHVVFLESAGHGHINPTAPLVAAMIDSGIKVTYFACSTETFPMKDDAVEDGSVLGELVKSAGATLRPYRPDHSLDNDPLLVSNGNPMHPGRYITWLPALLEDMRALQPPADVIVYDCFGVLPQIAGKILSIPAVGLIPNTGPSCTAAYETADAPALFEGPCKFVMERYGVDILETGIPCMSWYSSLLNVVLTCEELFLGFANDAQRSKFGAADFHCVGSLINPQSTKRAPIEDFPMQTITAARDSGRKVILLSLGTAVTGMFFSRNLPRGENGLADSTGRDLAHFVWKAAFEALGGSDEIFVVMATGSRPDAIDGLGDVPKNFLPVAVVPQLEVLPLCSAFITHGGMGSVMESIVYNVPMIVVPAFGDQIENADSIQRTNMGFGFRYPLKTLSVESLSKAVAELLCPEPTNKYMAAVKSSKEKMETTGGVAKAIEIITSVTK